MVTLIKGKTFVLFPIFTVLHFIQRLGKKIRKNKHKNYKEINFTDSVLFDKFNYSVIMMNIPQKQPMSCIPNHLPNLKKH